MEQRILPVMLVEERGLVPTVTELHPPRRSNSAVVPVFFETPWRSRKTGRSGYFCVLPATYPLGLPFVQRASANRVIRVQPRNGESVALRQAARDGRARHLSSL